MIKLLSFYLFLFFNCFVSIEARSLDHIKRSGFLIVAVDGMSPPFNYYKENQLVGFEIDLIKEISHNMKLDIQWVIQTFNTLLVSLENDTFDIIGTSHTITPERSEIVEFIRPHYCNDTVIVSKLFGPLKLVELEGKRVSVGTGTVFYEYLKNISSIKDLRTLQSEAEGIQDLLADRADAWVTEKPIATGTIKIMNVVDMFSIGEVLFKQINAMSVAKKNIPLQLEITQELTKLIENGTYDKLIKNYFDDDIRCY